MDDARKHGPFSTRKLASVLLDKFETFKNAGDAGQSPLFVICEIAVSLYNERLNLSKIDRFSSKVVCTMLFQMETVSIDTFWRGAAVNPFIEALAPKPTRTSRPTTWSLAGAPIAPR